MQISALARCAVVALVAGVVFASPALAQEKVTYNMSWLPPVVDASLIEGKIELAECNPEKAADILVKAFPTVDRGVALEQTVDINDLIFDAKAQQQGVRYLRDDRARSTVGFVDKTYGLNGKVGAGDIYTDDLLK